VESTNSNSVGVDKAKATLQQGIEELLTKAHTTHDHGIGIIHNFVQISGDIWPFFPLGSDHMFLLTVGAIVLCMAGVDRPDDKARVKGWVTEVLPKTTHVTIDNDAVAALASGMEKKTKMHSKCQES
jgi:hypothetical protein